MKNVNQMFFLEKEVEHIGLPKEEIYNYFVYLIYNIFKKKYCYEVDAEKTIKYMIEKFFDN